MNAQNNQIGQRIRALRLSRSMTQKQLAGDSITRNMLSLIENGIASPSLDTLTQLAKRLQVPVGYFFASSDEEIAHFLKMSMIEDIRKLYAAGNYVACLNMCASLAKSDDEILLITAECNLALAYGACRDYALASASAYLEKADAAASRCVYLAERVSATVQYLGLMIHSVSSSDIPKELGNSSAFPNSYIPPEIFVYANALHQFEKGNTNIAAALSQSSLIENPLYLDFLRAKAMIAGDEAENAAPLLRRIAVVPSLGFFTKLHVLNALEFCASASGDFKNAYQFSTQKVHLLEQFTK